MGARDAIQRTFRELLKEKPYSKITVTEICRASHLSRKTFYSNFQDKEDIAESIFEDGVIAPIRTMNEMFTIEQRSSLSDMIMESIYEAVAEDGGYYRDLVEPMKGTDDTFIRIATRSLERLNNEILDSIADLDEREQEYTSYFFAASQAMLIQKWIFDGMPFAPKELFELYKKMMSSYWHSFV